MGPDDATDVAKALAAFGAPSIRYHSFGQGQVKPSSVVLPRLGLAPLEPAANPAPAPLAAMPANPMLSMLPTAPRPAGPVLRPAATSQGAVPLMPPQPITPQPITPLLAVPPLAVPPLAVPPLDMPPLDTPMPLMPAFRRTPDPAASPLSVLSPAAASHAPARHGPATQPSAAIAMTLRGLQETGQTVSEGPPASARQTPPTAFAATRLSARSLSAPPISIQVNAVPKLAVLPLLGRSALAGQPGQSLAAIFAFLASDPMPGENSSLL